MPLLPPQSVYTIHSSIEAKRRIGGSLLQECRKHIIIVDSKNRTAGVISSLYCDTYGASMKIQ